MKTWPKCQTATEERIIGAKKRSACPKCGWLNYENLGRTGYGVHMDHIITDIVKTGRHEIPYTVLANTTFQEHYGGHSTIDQITEWCEMHELNFNIEERKDSIGKPVKFIRFTRAIA